MSKNKGFTLIELSMVLIIIGLVSGVIVVGRDLIHTAELRADITMTRDVSLAISAFRLKYNCLPGDCDTASEKLTGAFDGDGNGAIGLPVGAGGNYSMMFPALWSSDGAIESITVYDHLARANMMAIAPFYSGDGAAVVSQALSSLGSVMPTLKSQNRMAGALPGCRFTC
jgi:prepilin-type N-terminal cleavage/methylation domain-containing protein